LLLVVTRRKLDQFGERYAPFPWTFAKRKEEFEKTK